MTMVLDYYIALDDLLEFRKRYLYSDPQEKLEAYRIPIVITLITIFQNLGNFSFKYLFVAVAILALIFIWWPKYHRRGRLKEAKAFYSKPENGLYIGAFQLIFGEKGIENKHDGFDLTMDWELISKVEETKDYIYIYYSSSEAFIIPKQHIDMALLVEVRDILRSKVSMYKAA